MQIKPLTKAIGRSSCTQEPCVHASFSDFTHLWLFSVSLSFCVSDRIADSRYKVKTFFCSGHVCDKYRGTLSMHTHTHTRQQHPLVRKYGVVLMQDDKLVSHSNMITLTVTGMLYLHHVDKLQPSSRQHTPVRRSSYADRSPSLSPT